MPALKQELFEKLRVRWVSQSAFFAQKASMESVTAHIRKFRETDIHDVLAIEKQSFPKSPYSKETFLYFARTRSDSFCIVEVDNYTAGYIIFDASGHIYSIVVNPEYRRKGLGTKLIFHALTQVKKMVWLEVRSKNLGAILFYRSIGMKTSGKIPGYYENDDALVMMLWP